MDASGFEKIVAARFSEISDGGPDQTDWFKTVLDVIRGLAADYKSALPSRDVFLAAIGRAMDRIFAGIDTPGPDVIVEPLIKMAVLSIAGRIYDHVVA